MVASGPVWEGFFCYCGESTLKEKVIFLGGYHFIHIQENKIWQQIR